MLVRSMDPKFYKSDGRCVFCRCNLSDLPPEQITDEHIIPRALQGLLVIKDGACVKCAAYSNATYENWVLNNDLLPARKALELKKPRRRGTRKQSKQMNALVNETTGEILPPQALNMFVLIEMAPAGRLVGIDRGANVEARWVPYRISRFKQALPTSSDKIVFTTDFSPDKFCLMVAKIAYCYAMVEIGEDAVDMTDIRSLLAGERPDVWNFVGSVPEHQLISRRKLHSLHIRYREDGWVTVLVSLLQPFERAFERNDCRPYEVVLGRKRAALSAP